MFMVMIKSNRSILQFFKTHAWLVIVLGTIFVICATYFGLVLFQLNDKSLPTSFVLETKRINYSAKTAGSNWFPK